MIGSNNEKNICVSFYTADEKNYVNMKIFLVRNLKTGIYQKPGQLECLLFVYLVELNKSMIKIITSFSQKY